MQILLPIEVPLASFGYRDQMKGLQGHLDIEINYTYIVFIPKIKNSLIASDYQSISLCNVVYKMTSKVLANRLKKVLPFIISDNQSAFLKDRLITDNIIIAYENLHSMRAKQKGKDESMAIKLDISKAYDRIE